MDTWNEIDEWIARYLQGELPEQDKSSLIRWLEASPEHEKYFREILRTKVHVDAVGKRSRLERMQEDVWKRITPILERRRRLWYAWGSSVAAVVMVLVGALFVLLGQPEKKCLYKFLGVVFKILKRYAK